MAGISSDDERSPGIARDNPPRNFPTECRRIRDELGCSFAEAIRIYRERHGVSASLAKKISRAGIKGDAKREQSSARTITPQNYAALERIRCKGQSLMRKQDKLVEAVRAITGGAEADEILDFVIIGHLTVNKFLKAMNITVIEKTNE